MDNAEFFEIYQMPDLCVKFLHPNITFKNFDGSEIKTYFGIETSIDVIKAFISDDKYSLKDMRFSVLKQSSKANSNISNNQNNQPKNEQIQPQKQETTNKSQPKPPQNPQNQFFSPQPPSTKANSTSPHSKRPTNSSSHNIEATNATPRLNANSPIAGRSPSVGKTNKQNRNPNRPISIVYTQSQRGANRPAITTSNKQRKIGSQAAMQQREAAGSNQKVTEIKSGIGQTQKGLGTPGTGITRGSTIQRGSKLKERASSVQTKESQPQTTVDSAAKSGIKSDKGQSNQSTKTEKDKQSNMPSNRQPPKTGTAPKNPVKSDKGQVKPKGPSKPKNATTHSQNQQQTLEPKKKAKQDQNQTNLDNHEIDKEIQKTATTSGPRTANKDISNDHSQIETEQEKEEPKTTEEASPRLPDLQPLWIDMDGIATFGDLVEKYYDFEKGDVIQITYDKRQRKEYQTDQDINEQIEFIPHIYDEEGVHKFGSEIVPFEVLQKKSIGDIKRLLEAQFDSGKCNSNFTGKISVHEANPHLSSKNPNRYKPRIRSIEGSRKEDKLFRTILITEKCKLLTEDDDEKSLIGIKKIFVYFTKSSLMNIDQNALNFNPLCTKLYERKSLKIDEIVIVDLYEEERRITEFETEKFDLSSLTVGEFTKMVSEKVGREIDDFSLFAKRDMSNVLLYMQNELVDDIIKSTGQAQFMYMEIEDKKKMIPSMLRKFKQLTKESMNDDELNKIFIHCGRSTDITISTIQFYA